MFFLSLKTILYENSNEMDESRTKEIKELISKRIKELKGNTPYDKLATKSNITSARFSDSANNRINYQISTLIEIATALRIHPKELFELEFDFEQYYKDLDKAEEKSSI